MGRSAGEVQRLGPGLANLETARQETARKRQAWGKGEEEQRKGKGKGKEGEMKKGKEKRRRKAKPSSSLVRSRWTRDSNHAIDQNKLVAAAWYMSNYF